MARNRKFDYHNMNPKYKRSLNMDISGISMMFRCDECDTLCQDGNDAPFPILFKCHECGQEYQIKSMDITKVIKLKLKETQEIINWVRENETIGIITSCNTEDIIKQVKDSIERMCPYKKLVKHTRNQLLYDDAMWIIAVGSKSRFDLMFKGITVNNLFIENSIDDNTYNIIKNHMIPITSTVNGNIFRFKRKEKTNFNVVVIPEDEPTKNRPYK